MKGITIIYDCAIENKILKLFSDNGIERFAKADNMKCEWRKDLRHMDTHTWPGTDSLIHLFLEDDTAKTFMDSFRNFKENLEEKVPLFAVVVNIEDMA